MSLCLNFTRMEVTVKPIYDLKGCEQVTRKLWQIMNIKKTTGFRRNPPDLKKN